MGRSSCVEKFYILSNNFSQKTFVHHFKLQLIGFIRGLGSSQQLDRCCLLRVSGDVGPSFEPMGTELERDERGQDDGEAQSHAAQKTSNYHGLLFISREKIF